MVACENCGISTRNIHYHHQTPRCQGGHDSPDNLVALCPSCHRQHGILCVDLPPEEAAKYEKAFSDAGLHTIFLLAPTSTDERVELISRHSSGFIYYVSRTGVTGEQDSIESSVRPMVENIKQHTDLPVAVGFGISTPEQAREIAAYGDGVVVGSAIVRMIGELGDTPETAGKVGAFVKSLVDAVKAPV